MTPEKPQGLKRSIVNEIDCTDLREFMDLVGKDRAWKAISSFSVKKNPGAESFIRDNAAAYEKNDNASHDDLMRRDLIDFAIEYVMAAKRYAGGSFPLMDCVDDLVEPYGKRDFIKICKTVDLNQLIMFLKQGSRYGASSKILIRFIRAYVGKPSCLLF